ncbi:hypothetical protein SAMN05444008_101237 [Cnuella takakiae]|uniref:Uncharacterized protein n=1 Tax=Cnuella takakiae TaxID=1302690 RepID=A0A1M4SU39_9BACT|nr:hypothetical protein SAMN05444008_101237 [Cnuella takakiae]
MFTSKSIKHTYYTLLLVGMQGRAQLSTVGVIGRKVSRAVQRGVEKPEQDSMRMPPADTTVYNKE